LEPAPQLTPESATTTTVQCERAANDPAQAPDALGDELSLMVAETPASGTATGRSGPLAARVLNFSDSQRRDAERVERELHDERAKHTARSKGYQQAFDPLPKAVFKSPQFYALSQHAQLLLYQVAQAVYGSNGFIRLTRTQLAPLGWRSHATIDRAISELVTAGFLRVTRPADQARRRCAYYYPTWIAMKGERVAPNNWAQFSPKSKPSAVLRKAA
jgi:hypothetical protein